MKKYLYIAAITVMAAPAAYAADNAPNTFDHVKAGFAQAVDGISGWFGSDNAALTNIEPAAGNATGNDELVYQGPDEVLSIPPQVDPSMIEPAAGAVYDEDALQVPPQYIAPVSNVAPRATAFDNNQSIAAFGVSEPTAYELAGIATAAGDTSDVTCEIEADEKLAVEGEETQKVSCPAAGVANAEPEKTPAQPAFEPEPVSGDLPETRPAAGQ